LIEIEFEVHGVRRAVSYPDNFNQVFYEWRKDKEPRKLRIQQLRKGVLVYCAKDEITRNLEAAQKFASQAHKKPIREVLTALECLDNFNDAVRTHQTFLFSEFRLKSG